MKLAAPLVVISLCANVALGWQLLHPPLGVLAARASAPHPANRSPDAASAHAPAITTLLSSAPPAEAYSIWRDRLIAIGIPSDVVRDVIRACLEEPRLARQRGFYAEASRRPWWQGGLGAQDLTSARQKELGALRQAEREEILRVLGPAGLATDADLERYSYLAPDKAAQLAALESEYNQARRAANAATSAADPNRAERLRVLSEERDRNLAALLTADERAAFADRESTSAISLSYRLEYFTATDAEYQTLMGIQKEFDAGFHRRTQILETPRCSRRAGRHSRNMKPISRPPLARIAMAYI
jgi:hypothetical protein